MKLCWGRWKGGLRLRLARFLVPWAPVRSHHLWRRQSQEPGGSAVQTSKLLALWVAPACLHLVEFRPQAAVAQPLGLPDRRQSCLACTGWHD